MDINDTNCIWITEVWDIKEDHYNSLKINGVKELISGALPILVVLLKRVKNKWC
jgi:hypothetical protein